MTHQVCNDITVTFSPELVMRQTLPQLLVVINLSIHLRFFFFNTMKTKIKFKIRKASKGLRNHKKNRFHCKILRRKAYRDNDGLVLVEEWLITRSRINDSQPLMGKKAISVLVQTTPVRATVLQSG